MASRGRATLQQGLDREVYQVVTKFLDERNESPLKIRSYTLYDWIKNSNSSLKRRPKKQLEDSIDRVLAVLQEDESGDEEVAELDGFAQEEAAKKEKKSHSTDLMNRSIVNSWAVSSGTATPTGEKSKKRDGSKVNGERDSKKVRRSEKEKEREGQKISTSPPTHLNLEDVGGVDDVKAQLKDHLVMPLLRPEDYVRRGIPIPRGILLHGPPGCGKTVICRAFAAKLGVPFIEILGPSVVSGMSGESEKQIREHFERAKEVAPCLIFIDEIDVIAPKRDTAQSQMEKRIVAQLLISMDGLAMESNDGKPVIVLAATNRPDSIDPALRRGGRFDTEINMGVPNEGMRELILKALTRGPKLAEDVEFKSLAKMTAGFVGADLRDLVSKAGTWSMNQYIKALEKQAAESVTEMDIDDSPAITMGSEMDRSIDRLVQRARDQEMPVPPGFEDETIKMEAFASVLPSIIPSSKREGFATIPDTTWRDVGALENVREELQMAIVEPIKNPQRYKKVGISAPTGVLLWGPPGCGKTLLAKAVAAESKANFISVKGPELLNKYVGESERAVRQVFTRARSSIPCVIFFDELDALVPHRNSEQSEASARVVNTLLTELDGLSTREGIYLIAATNRPEMIDRAMLRPGRLETLLYVELPKPEERVSILKALIQKTPGMSLDLAEVARKEDCKDFSGADLSALLRRAAQHCLRAGRDMVEEIDLEVAAKHIKPSVGDIRNYERLRKEFETKLW